LHAKQSTYPGFLHFIKETEFDNHNFFSGAKRILQEILDAATMKEMTMKEMVVRYAVLFEINAGAAPIKILRYIILPLFMCCRLAIFKDYAKSVFLYSLALHFDSINKIALLYDTVRVQVDKEKNDIKNLY
ncbi:hypothetical protein ACJX0J_023600, partial [Zea mays]